MLSFGCSKLSLLALWALSIAIGPSSVSSFVVPQCRPSAQRSSNLWQPILSSQPIKKAPANGLHLGRQDDEQNSRPSKRKAIARRTKSLIRRVKKPLIPLACAFLVWASRGDPVEAKMSHEVTKSPTHSLRPGMSKEDIEDVMAGKKDIKEHDPSGAVTTEPTKAPKKSPTKSIYGDDDDDDFDLDYDEDYATRKVATQSDLARSQKLQASRKSQFAYRTEQSKTLYIKVCAGVFLPTFGTMFAREHFRQRREEAYVQKGLEILEAQKAEYFNITTKSEDSDLEDALKGMKNNTTDTDEDDDDEDDDDEDEDDDDAEGYPTRGRGPKSPRGGGNGGGSGGGSSGSGSGSDSSDDGVSDEDRDRLKDLFDKS